MYGYIWGALFYFFHVFWIKIYHPLALPALLLVVSLFVALSFFVSFYLFPPAVFTLVEYLKSYATILGFPWGIPALALAKVPWLLQTLPWIGTFGLVFLIYFINYAFSSKKLWLAMLLLGIVVCPALFPKNVAPDSEIQFVALQPNFPVWEHWSWKEHAAQVRDFVQSAVANFVPHKRKLIVTSETLVKTALLMDLEEKTWWETLCLKTASAAVVGSYRVSEDCVWNSAFLFDPFYTDYYDKIHLVPLGEFVPFKSVFPFLSRMAEEAGAGEFCFGKRYTVFKIPEGKFSVVICYEMVFGNLIRQFVKRGAQLLINITNDRWTESPTAHWQHALFSVLRAVEFRRWVLRVGNSGVTMLVSPTGKIEKFLPPLTKGVLTGKVYFTNIQTFYSKIGDLPLIGVLLTLLFLNFIMKIWQYWQLKRC